MSAHRAGWVAAVQLKEDEPTWLVSATTADELDAAAALVEEETLRDRYAVATLGGEPVPLPPSPPLPELTAGCPRSAA